MSYIEFEAVQRIMEDLKIEFSPSKWCLIDVASYHILQLPTTEIRHGEWVEQVKETLIPVEFDSNGDPILHKVIEYKCSLCGRLEGKKEPYCNCGTKMDGGND